MHLPHSLHFLIYPGTLLISSFEKSPLSHSALVVFIPSPTHFHPTICCSQLHTIAGVRLQKIPTGVPPKIALGVKIPTLLWVQKNKSQLLAQLHPAPPHFPWPACSQLQRVRYQHKRLKVLVDSG